MSRNKLKVLNKTPKDYIFKNFIYISKSPIITLVLFIKKLNKGL